MKQEEAKLQAKIYRYEHPDRGALSDKVKEHLQSPFTPTVWFDWNDNLPNKVEVVCGELSRRYGKLLNVRQWLIDPPKCGLRETLVAEVDVKETSKYSNDDYVQICVTHLVPATS